MSAERTPDPDARPPRDEEIALAPCPVCGRTVEFWPDEMERTCPGCGHCVVQPENVLRCMEWCEYGHLCTEREELPQDSRRKTGGRQNHRAD